MGKGFKTAKIGELGATTKKSKFTSFGILKRLIVVICIAAILFFGKYLLQGGQILLGIIGQNTVKTVSKNLGEDMKKDGSGNINILIIGIGGDNHQGGYLADTMIVASRNPEKGAVSMISIPRDLYVSASGYVGKINSLFARGRNKGGSIQSGVDVLGSKISQIVGMDIPYYIVADFQGFKEVVDTLGGIDMYIPETIHDTTYPDNNLGYQTFHISAGHQHLDGETALKYARSRHTTSDFSRSARQQEIIKAVIAKALQKENITSISKLREFYDTYTRMVNTNITSKEMIGMVKYIYNFKEIFTFGFNTYCTYSSYKVTDTACFLYNANREAFNGLAAIIPNGATPSNISFYEYTQNFAHFVSYNQEFLLEHPKIVVINAIDKSYASSKGKSPTGWANKLAVKLKKYGFNISNIENTSDPFAATTAIVYGDDFENTIKALNQFIPIQFVTTGQLLSGQTIDDLGHNIELFIGNDFIDYITTNPFSYEK